MASSQWSDADLQQMASLGIDPVEASRQLALFRDPPAHLVIDRPATVGNGVRVLTEEQREQAVRLADEAAAAGRFLKFVPASGAATRMFHSLLETLHRPDFSLETLRIEAERGSADSAQIIQLLDSLDRAAFYGPLREALSRNGRKIEELRKDKRYREVLEALLFAEGLNSSQKPKAVIPFHAYGPEPRTPIEEHLVEAAHYARDAQGLCRVHFTVSEEHLPEIRSFVERAKGRFEGAFGVRYEVGFSVQHPGTNTLAVDEKNDPFRDHAGRLAFRPGGHGALLGNLNALNGDLVYIKNIDNVTVEPKLGPTLYWKKVLGGHLAGLQAKVFAHLGELAKEGNGDPVSVLRFVRVELGVPLGPEIEKLPREEQAAVLREVLDRPLRVCGVVPNTGEPGGGPFWVKTPDGKTSLQIVESAQIDTEHPGQRTIFSRSTHFNPVDLVCAVRDREGNPYDLMRFMDPNAVFISRKSMGGRKLKALELPGLWNGAMAHWNTVLVEVPLETFNPVKTVFDLFKPAHQSNPI